MKTIVKLLGFPEDICYYFEKFYYELYCSPIQCLTYHIRRTKYIHTIQGKSVDLHFSLNPLEHRTLYDQEFKMLLPRYFIHADPFEIYICGSWNLNTKQWSIKERIKKCKIILHDHNMTFIFCKLIKNATQEGYYLKNDKNKLWNHCK